MRAKLPKHVTRDSGKCVAWWCHKSRDYFKSYPFQLYLANLKANKLLQHVIWDSGMFVVWWLHKSRDSIKFSILPVSCLIRRLKVPNYYNLSYETNGWVLLDNVTSHVKIRYFAQILLSFEGYDCKIVLTCYTSYKETNACTGHVTTAWRTCNWFQVSENINIVS